MTKRGVISEPLFLLAGMREDCLKEQQYSEGSAAGQNLRLAKAHLPLKMGREALLPTTSCGEAERRGRESNTPHGGERMEAGSRGALLCSTSTGQGV